LKRIHPVHVALSGVLAARYWDPNFNLHGTPRLDLVVHAPTGRANLDFVRSLDPALAQVEDTREPAAVVVHPLVRRSPLFTGKSDANVPWADPVETVLDLYDLSLIRQGNQLLTHLRREVRLA
jgi:hypothetical protein